MELSKFFLTEMNGNGTFKIFLMKTNGNGIPLNVILFLLNGIPFPFPFADHTNGIPQAM